MSEITRNPINPLIRGRDWDQEMRRRNLGATAGTGLTTTPTNQKAPTCGRNIDSSVFVGGVGGIVNLQTRFPGGIVTDNGGITNVDGATDTNLFPWVAPTTFYFSDQIKPGDTSSGPVGYEIINAGPDDAGDRIQCFWNTDGTIKIYTGPNGGPYTLRKTSAKTITRDTNTHTFAVVIGIVNSGVGNILQRAITFTVDGNAIARYVDIEVAAYDFTSPLKLTVHTSGQLGVLSNYAAGGTGFQAGSSGGNGQISIGGVPGNTLVYSYVENSTSDLEITWDWAAFQVEDADQTFQNVASSTAGTHYVSPHLDCTIARTWYYLSYWDNDLGLPQFVLSDQGSPAGTSPFIMPLANIGNYDGRTLIGINIPVATGAYSGGVHSGGGGGGKDNCPAIDQVLLYRRHGVEIFGMADTVRASDQVPYENYWVDVIGSRTIDAECTYVTIGDMRWHVDVEHRWLRAGYKPLANFETPWIRTHDLSLNTLIAGPDDTAIPVRGISEPHAWKIQEIQTKQGTYKMVSKDRKGLIVHNAIITF